MELYVARQPIFDVHDRVVGYELLHRQSRVNRFDSTAGIDATGQLLSDHLLTDAWSELTGGQRAWVNFSADALVKGYPLLVPPERIVVELVEDVVADSAVLTACSDLADRGYLLAADDVADPRDPNPLLSLVDFIKVDFRATSPEQRASLVQRFAGNALLLAEKVETPAERAEALDAGYELFQGDYLRSPTVVAQRAVDRTRLGTLAVVAAAGRYPMDFDEVSAALKTDVALTDRFLRFLNSAAFGWSSPVRTITEGLVRLGEVQARRWIVVAAMTTVGSDTSSELIVSTLLRAHMCEQLARHLADAEPFELFLTGLYSQMHLLLETERETAIGQAPVPPDVRDALLEQDGLLWQVLELVTAWEAGQWDQALELADALGVPPDAVRAAYVAAIAYGDSIHRAQDEPSRAAAARG